MVYSFGGGGVFVLLMEDLTSQAKFDPDRLFQVVFQGSHCVKDLPD